MVCVSTCPETWNRWPLDSLVIQKESQVRPLSKQQLFHAQHAAHRPVWGLMNKEEGADHRKHHAARPQISLRRSEEGTSSELSRTMLPLQTPDGSRSEWWEVGRADSKPRCSEQTWALATRLKELEMVLRKHLTRKGAWRQKLGGFLPKWSWRGRETAGLCAHRNPSFSGTHVPLKCWGWLQAYFPHWLEFLECFFFISDRFSKEKAPNILSCSLPEPQSLSQV